MSNPVLRIQDLRVYYHTARGPAKAVDGLSFELEPNTRLGLVGESGSGKSTMALALMRMIKAPGRIEGGQMWLGDVDLATLSPEAMRQVRLSQISMIPQGAMNSLNPVVRVRKQMIDAIYAHNLKLTTKAIDKRIAEVLDWVDLEPAVANMFPHELSGGMKQRVCIAIAILLKPKVIIADEPTSALDVVVQRQVMETIGRVQAELGASVILIGHDMGLMVQFVNRMIVMYAGKIAEMGVIRELFTQPLHPYTQLLISSLPRLESKGELQGIPGIAPSLLSPPSGCVFHPRCPHVMDICSQQPPSLLTMNGEQRVSCHLYNGRTALAYDSAKENQ